MGSTRIAAIAARLGLVLAAGAVGAGAPQAEIFQWVDEQGRMHFAQDLHSVPPRFRRQAQDRAGAAQRRAGAPRVQTYEPPASIAPLRPKPSRSEGFLDGAAGRTHRIPVERAGNSLRVMVRINNSVNAPFIIDTGASIVAVPRWVVDRAGIDLAGARTALFQTANGVIEKPLLTLDSVQLGTARVEGVQASVSDTMEIGLLGLTFFNHFQYEVDPVRGIVTLTENGMARAGLIRGGRSEAQWSAEFHYLRRRIAQVEEEKDDTPRSHGREHDRLEERIEELERQLELLEAEADAAHVPWTWRD